ncbi:phage tail protein [Denitromonas halophila]|uniref:Phage tail protein n=1 Tax=Denitromonas halophila TaxID=1629404 RepID=A0A557QX80_9RHOO|nr:phage tail protein [Denitromonas halophila]TVO57524.1 phage tail protein [Denitromonas halophila]
MALQEYLGAIVMEIDGQEIEVDSLDVTHNTGRRLVKTMNKTGRAKGFSKGIEEFSLRLTVSIPADGSEPDWKNIQGAKVTVSPLGGGKRTSYLDCFVTETGGKYGVDGDAKRDLSMMALREVSE